MSQTKQQKTIVIAAGGTGGHVIPGLAVAAELQARGHEVHWLGTAVGIEAKLVPAAGLPLHLIQISGFRGKGALAKLAVPFKLLRGLLQSWRQLRRLRADAVVAMGGFVAGPTGMAAKLSGRTLIVQEQNAVAGTTNRLLARWAKRVLTAFAQAFPERGEVLGNPVREEIASIEPPSQRDLGRGDRLRLLVLGGSLGADALNRGIANAVASMPAEVRPTVIHQCGAKHVEVAEQAYAAAEVAAEVVPYIDDMAAAYANADVVVCRAGALTVSEVAAAGVPAIFVPLPHAIDDHQTANARSMTDVEAGVLMPQLQLSAENLSKQLAKFNQDRAMLRRMAVAARAQAKPQATQQIVDVIEDELGVSKAIAEPKHEEAKHD